jgi:Na+-translocating ferredoxin:NAD+ oxidoreductase RnfC subunit
VTIPLKMHVGAPATPVVRFGDRVRAGQRIADPPATGLGVAIHSSVDGVVLAVGDAVTIARA